MSTSQDIQEKSPPGVGEIVQETEPLKPVPTTPLPELQEQDVEKKGQENTQEAKAKTQKRSEPKEHSNSGWITTINRPWLLLTIPGVIGGIWLANNSWVITNNIDKPYALAAGPALVVSFLIGWLIINFFKAIVNWCQSAWNEFQHARKEDGSALFFWTVIVVFMIVSVFASGAFFNELEHNALPGLGYVTALFIDLVAVQAMRARLNAVRMRDKKGSQLYLFGVLLCAGASAFANVYTSLADFHQTVSGALPVWMLFVAPWFGLVFPALILLLSVTADYTLDQISTKLDPEQYKAQETKRIKLLEYQRDALRERLAFEQEIDQLNRSLLHSKERRTFFLINWLFPLRQPALVQSDVDVQKIIDDVENTLRPWFQFLDNKSNAQGHILDTVKTSVSHVDSDVQLLIGEIQNIQAAKQAEDNSQRSVLSERKNHRSGNEMSQILSKRGTRKTQIPLSSDQLSPKFPNFRRNAIHEKALELLQSFPERAAFEEKIQSNPTQGYEDLVTYLRQIRGLNYGFLTPKFAAEIWSLYQIEHENQADPLEEKGTSSSPSPEQRDQFSGQDVSPSVTREEVVKAPAEAEQDGEEGVNRHQNGEAGGEASLLREDGTSTSIHSKKAEDLEGIQADPTADHLSGSPMIGIDPRTRTEGNSTIKLARHIILESDDSERISEISDQGDRDDQFEKTPNISEILSEGDQISPKFIEDRGKIEGVSQSDQDISDHPIVQDETYQEGSNDTEDISSEPGRKKSAHGPHSLSIEEVAKQFSTTAQIIEAAIDSGTLQLAKRGKNKILVSSLQNFSPPRKRGRRPTKKFVETQEAVLV